MSVSWIKGRQPDPYQRPRIDWWQTWAQFIPFWVIILTAMLWWTFGFVSGYTVREQTEPIAMFDDRFGNWLFGGRHPLNIPYQHGMWHWT